MAAAEDPAARPETARRVAPNASTGGGVRTGLKVGGWIVAVLGVVLVVAGVALIVVHLTQRDKDGYYTSSTIHIAAPGYAVTTEGLDFGDLPSFTTDAVGRVRVVARLTASWKVKGGTWAIVLMNASGAAPVDADVTVGVQTNLLLWIGLGFLLVGVIAGGSGIAMLLSSRSPRPTATNGFTSA